MAEGKPARCPASAGAIQPFGARRARYRRGRGKKRLDEPERGVWLAMDAPSSRESGPGQEAHRVTSRPPPGGRRGPLVRPLAARPSSIATGFSRSGWPPARACPPPRRRASSARAGGARRRGSRGRSTLLRRWSSNPCSVPPRPGPPRRPPRPRPPARGEHQASLTRFCPERDRGARSKSTARRPVLRLRSARPNFGEGGGSRLQHMKRSHPRARQGRRSPLGQHDMVALCLEARATVPGACGEPDRAPGALR